MIKLFRVKGDYMANDGVQFKLNYQNGVANDKAIFKGTKYRITILTERLVRLEYSENGVFLMV